MNIRFSQPVNWRNCLLSAVYLPQLWTTNTWTYLWLLVCLIWTRISFYGNAMLLDFSKVLLHYRIISMVSWAFFFNRYVSFLISFWLFDIFCGYVNSIDVYLFLYLFPTSHDVAQANFILAPTQSLLTFWVLGSQISATHIVYYHCFHFLHKKPLTFRCKLYWIYRFLWELWIYLQYFICKYEILPYLYFLKLYVKVL